MKRILIILTLILVGAGVLFVINLNNNGPQETASPSPTMTVSPTASPSGSPQEANITVTSPKSGATVRNPITVTGKARVFENTFAYALKDTTGKVLYENFAMTDAGDAGIFGNYSVKIPVPVNAPRDLIVEVFEYSARDGSIINLVRVPVRLASQQTITLKAYFSKPEFSQTDCSKVEAVNRTVITTQEPAFISLTELLKGPSDAEKQADYFTSIPNDVRINSISIRSRVAYADFDETLQFQVGGSCRVTAIRAQITETLKQFSTVNNVVISINGRTNDILQP